MRKVLFFPLLVACISWSVAQHRQASLDSAAIQQVFGAPPPPTIPHNETLIDPDYWDSVDDFKPSSLFYDQFDWAFVKRIAGSTEGNALVSPLSLKLALAILNEAATGITRTEIEIVLGFPTVRQEVRKKFASILESLQTKTNQYILELGSRIYVGAEVKIRQMFAAIAQEFYKTEIRNIQLDNPQAAAVEANAWIANVTNNRITNLLSEGDLQGVVAMVLNTIYFKGTWRHQFALNDTKDGIFHMPNLRQVSVPFMHQKSHFFYADSTTLDAQILRMPYLGKKFSMYVILPHSIDGVSRLTGMLGSFQLRKELFYLQEHLVQVVIPRFHFEFQSHPKKQLQDVRQCDALAKVYINKAIIVYNKSSYFCRKMGIRQAFEDFASFPGIARGQTLQQRLKISSVLQKSGIELNELGSTAYAATEVSLVNKFGEDDESAIDFVANKPFLFFIEDELTRQVLFAGQLMNPLQTIGTLGNEQTMALPVKGQATGA